MQVVKNACYFYLVNYGVFDKHSHLAPLLLVEVDDPACCLATQCKGMPNPCPLQLDAVNFYIFFIVTKFIVWYFL